MVSASSASPIPVTLVGFGSSAHTFHLPFLLSLPQQFQLFSIQQRPGSSQPRATDTFPGVRVHDSIDAIFEGPNRLPIGGLVVITITNVLHYSTAKLALQHGCHVLCEKPLALSSDQVKDLQATAQKHGVVCYTYQNRRFDSDFLTLQSVLPADVVKAPLNSLAVAGYEKSSDSIGQARFFESHFDRFRPLAKGGWREQVTPEQGGGILWDLGSHLVDQAINLFGPPQSVFGIVQNSRGQQNDDIDDSFEVHLFYPRRMQPLQADAPAAGTTPAGLHCRLSASVLAAEPAEQLLRFKVHGTRGSYVSYGLDPQESQLKAHTHVLSDQFGVHSPLSSASQAQITLLAGKERTRDYVNDPIQDKAKPIPLEAEHVPQLQGRYKALYNNLAQTISAANALQPTQVAERNQVISQVQAVPLDQVALAIRTLELARQSAREGRVIDFSS